MVTEPVTRLISNWAGLRTFAPDRVLVIGPDPGIPDFFWLAGQGGYGFQSSPAASQLAADLIAGRPSALPADLIAALSPARFRRSFPARVDLRQGNPCRSLPSSNRNSLGNPMTYRQKMTDIRQELRAMNKLIPETSAGFATLSKAAKDNGPLSAKEKEYIALAIAIALRCEPCIVFHVEALMKTGATREELGSVLAMTIQMGGGPAVMYSAHATAAWDEFAAATS
jgi:AhpD family alkylhydroperoxidase